MVYFDGICLYKFPPYQITDYDVFKSKFLEYENKFYKAYENGQYDNISIYIDKKFEPIIFNIFYHKMSDEDKFINYIYMYKNCDYALQKLPLKLIKEIYKFIPKDLLEKRKNSGLVDCNGYINIYRGVGSKSSKGSRAISWTTDKNVAKWFANRFNKVAKIINGKIHINDVIFIFDEELVYLSEDEFYKDEEKEIIVIPEKVVIIGEDKVNKN
ncbi:hypothetical protein ACJDT4_09355 [Clostridium neuense]|uniref:Uncharacterized protein n=1 Tax=Clostridium neuense TaxID=1728934 RepID=A0ABW8TG21_9CLOT